MKSSAVRDWIGKYFLLLTVFLGAYILLFAGKYTLFLRVSAEVGADCFQIIIPTLISQLIIIFRFYGTNKRFDNDADIDIPAYVVKWPPFLVVTVIVSTVLLMAFGAGKTWAPDEEQFKKIITFCVTLLNATTIFVVSRFFEAKPEGVRKRGTGQKNRVKERAPSTTRELPGEAEAGAAVTDDE